MIRLIAFLALALFAAPAFCADKPLRGVVELFTSQGCSSCPAADAILGDYAKSEDVLALAWHVDYWNYLGWEDTFSDPAFTARQQRYAEAMGRRGIYTPQAIVDGRDHAVGSRKGDIEALLAKTALTVPVSLSRAGDIVTANASGEGSATLWAIHYRPEAKVTVTRGENAGRKITYHNVVRAMEPMGMMTDGQLEIALPLTALRDSANAHGTSALAVILQRTGKSGLPGAIVGAARLGSLDR